MSLKSQVFSQGPRRTIVCEFLRQVLIWSLCLLGFLTFVRLIAFFAFGSGLSFFTGETLLAFLMGFRFDLSATCYFLALPLLVGIPWLSLGGTRGLWWLEKFVQLYFILVTTLVIFLSIIDLGYYTYFQDHLNIMIFGFFEDDTMALVQTMWKNYPVVWILSGLALSVFLLWKFLSRLIRLRPTSWSKPQLLFFPFYLVMILLIGIGARGSFGLFPLGVADATISNQPFVNYLAFSGVHSLHRAIKLKLRESSAWNINAKNYGYSNAKSAAQDFLGRELPDSADPLKWFERELPANAWANKTKPHVVVLMMESFGSYWISLNSEKFNLMGDLQKHFQEDPVFLNFVPSMTATIGSLSSLMINTAHRPEGGFLTENRYLQVPFRTAPARIYKQQGYRTRFIYGGAIGWRDIDKFARTQGFDSIEGDFEIEKTLGRTLEKHDWGFFDEDVWTYLEKTLNEATTPELVVVMTTTNHPPYQLPKNYQPLPLEFSNDLKRRLNVDLNLATSRFRAFQYSNQVLGQFLTRLKNSPLGDKTLLAATGDHGFLIVNFDESELLQKWQVPFYLYLPKAVRPKKIDQRIFGSHADIFATLMPYSIPGITVPLMGQNMLDPSVPHDAFHFSRLALNPDGAVMVESSKRTRFFEWQQDQQRLKASEETPQLSELAKKYKALMSFLDEYYEYERKHTRGQP